MTDQEYNLDEKFEKYTKKILKVSNVSDTEKLFLYAHYKQATIGKNNKEKPSILNRVEMEKWKAWNELDDMTNEIAKKIYIKKVKELCNKEGVK